VPVCDHIYRFTSLVMDESFMGLEHGIDERIPVDGMGKMVKFYAQLMQVWGTKEMVSLRKEFHHENSCRFRRQCFAQAGRADDARCPARQHPGGGAGLAPVAEHQLVLAHGNGPQVGLLALQARPTKMSKPIRWMCWAPRPRA
jgi:hypothetical protein